MKTSLNRRPQTELLYWVLTYCTICAAIGPAKAKVPTKIPIDIQAERLEVQRATRQVDFSGQVRITRGPLVMTCERLQARYGDGGQLNTLEATGNVTVVGPEFSATAQSARYDQERDVLELTGTPTLSRGASRLTARRVIIWLNEERVVIESAKGTLDPALLSPTQKAP